MKKGMTFSLATAAGLFVGGVASADVLFFDLDDPDGAEAYAAALEENGKVLKTSYDLNAQFGDPGIEGLDGPQDIADNFAIDSNLNPFGEGGRAGRGDGGTGLVIVGPSAGFGNPDTALLANFFVDSFDVFATADTHTAWDGTVGSLLGSNTVTVTVYDEQGNLVGQAGGLDAPASGHSYGIIATGGDTIGRVNIYDEGGGAEGIMGTGNFYVVPAPGALALVGIAGLVSRRRRRA